LYIHLICAGAFDLILYVLNLFINLNFKKMLQTLRYPKYFPFIKGNIFKTVILALILILGKFCLAQDLLNNNFKLKENTPNPNLSKILKSVKAVDTVSYPILLSFGVGAYTYKFVNMYYYELDILPHIGQRLYLETGLILYRTRYYDNEQITTDHLYLNLYFLHRWDIKNKIYIYGGGGFSISVPIGFIANIIIRGDYKMTKTINLGLEIKRVYILAVKIHLNIIYIQQYQLIYL